MILGLLFALMSGIAFSVVGIFFSHAARRNLDIIAFNLVAYSFVAVTGWFFCNWNAVLSWDIPEAGRFITVIISAGLISQTAMLLVMAAMKRGHQSATWTIAQSAMVLPFLAGLFIWHEAASSLNVIGVLLMVTCVALLRNSPEDEGNSRADRMWFPITILAFLCVGMGQTLFTVPSHWEGWVDAGRLRIPLCNSAAAIGLGVTCLITSRKPTFSIMRPALCCGVVLVIGHVVIFKAMDLMARIDKVAFVYPICTGTCILFFAIYSRLHLKEKLTTAAALGMACGIAGIVLLSL